MKLPAGAPACRLCRTAPLERGPCRTACRVANRCGLGALRHGCGSWVRPAGTFRTRSKPAGWLAKCSSAGTFDRFDDALAAADVFVTAATGDVPIALLEAMEAGLPIVTRPTPITAVCWRPTVRPSSSSHPPPNVWPPPSSACSKTENWPPGSARPPASHAVKRFSSQRMAEEHLRLFTSLIYERGKSKQRSRG